MTVCATERPYDFYAQRSLSVQVSDLELSADAGILLARQAAETVQVCQRLADCLEAWRDPHKSTHSLHPLVSQRVYQLVGGYEAANDSNQLRHDPIDQLACGRLPLADQEHLANQPTITRLENHLSKREGVRLRSQLVEGFIQRYKVAPAASVLDLDGWDDPTHGEQQLSCFHGYYGQHMYFPVLSNAASRGYPLVLQLRAGNSHSWQRCGGVAALVVRALKTSVSRCEAHPACRCRVLLTGKLAGL